MSTAFFGIQIEDTDGDLVEVSGDSREGLVTITLNFEQGLLDEEDEAVFTNVTPQDARVLAASLVMAAGQAEGIGIGL